QDRTREHAHERKVRIARELADMSQEVLKEQNWALDLDLDFGMGCFVEDLMLHPFDISEGNFSMEKAGDLMLRKTGSYQPVDYHLGKVPEKEDGGYRTALLTGANSGGKTTLLMTIAQIVMMANMGLPVPAEKASIPKITSLYIYRPKRMLDAGGLEGFLKELLPLSQYVDGSSMVLADELEAMTELEAASRIIGVFLKELEKKGAFSVIVTHMADEILRFANCRVDGIEAKGLDEKHNLIVDRTPRIGHHARSTPELIIRRLEAKASGKEKEVFSRVLKSFE
ncbi:MAG: endonuclease MutS2, partial [Candidatus Thermoplasmatota archaeon]|nr:endonuclease MutS2 [Candidatus Thermoplasmatota archaeon]